MKMKSGSTRRTASYLRRYWGLYLMLLLPMAWFAIFRYWPMWDLQLAFRANNIIAPILEVQWVGFDNFRWAFNHPPFRDAFRNTVVFSVLDLLAGFPAPILLALLLNELKFRKFKRVTQTISYMPHFLSWIIISGLALQLFSPTVGTINTVLFNVSGSLNNFLYSTFGVYEFFGRGPIPFLNSENHWIGTVVGLGVWRSVGWNTIIYLAAITAISPELYEAADADGANRLRKMWHITLPGIRPVIIILFILSIGGIMGADFERFMALGNPLVMRVSEVLPLYVWRWGLTRLQFASSTAVGLIQNSINLILLLSANFIVKKLGGSGLW